MRAQTTTVYLLIGLIVASVGAGFGIERPWMLIVLWPVLIGAVAFGVASVVFAYWFLDGVVVKTMELINGKARS